MQTPDPIKPVDEATTVRPAARHGADPVASEGLFASPITNLLPYQLAWVRDDARFKIGLWARQTGKSFSCAGEAVLESVTRAGTEWIILSAGERQALEFMRKAQDWALACKTSLKGFFERRIAPESLMKSAEIQWDNGSRMIALPANPDTARGYSANLILDEFAFHEQPEEIWRAIYPSISNPMKGGRKLRVVSTPNGKNNKFYEIWSQCAHYSHHRISMNEAVAQGLPINIEELRSGLNDPDGWAQEYECEFIDTASVLLPYDLIASCESPEASETAAPGYFDTGNHPAAGRFAGRSPRLAAAPLYVGIDVGRRRDLTVCWTIERLGDVWWTREVLALEETPFHEQLAQLLVRARVARMTVIDATGLGAMLAEELARHAGPGRVVPLSFSPSLKLELYPPLRRHFEEKSVRVPVSRAIREDLHGVRKITSPNGAIRYQAVQTEDGHSDRATALALALHGGREAARVPTAAPSFGSRGRLQTTRRSGSIES